MRTFGSVDELTATVGEDIGASSWREKAVARGDVNPTGGLEEVLAERLEVLRGRRTRAS